MRRLIALFCLLGLVGSVHADGSQRPALHWSRGAGASSCIDPHTLALRITALTGPVLVDAAEADVSIEGHVTRSARGVFEVRVTATGRDGVARGTRNLEHKDDCRALDDAVAFVVAVMIEPDLALERLPPELVALGAEGEASQTRLLRELEAEPPHAPASATPSPLAASASSILSPPPADTPTLPAKPLYQLHFGASIVVQELPRASAGMYLGMLFLPLRWLGLDLGLRATFMPGPLELEGDREIQARRFGSSLLACPRYPWPSMFVELCAGPQLALISANASGFDHNEVKRRAAFAAQLAVGYGAQLRGGWWLRLRAQLQLLLNDPSFTYKQLDAPPLAFEMSRLAVGADLGVGYQF
jgi:hypothetical protein